MQGHNNNGQEAERMEALRKSFAYLQERITRQPKQGLGPLNINDFSKVWDGGTAFGLFV